MDVEDKVYHPIIAERVPSMRANGTPSWITAASYTTIKGRKEKAKASLTSSLTSSFATLCLDRTGF